MSKFVKIPVEEVTTPKEGYSVYLNRYWQVRAGCVLGYKLYGAKDWPAPQCNLNKAITDRVKLANDETVFLPVAY